jgi:hypothetical protein
MRRLVSVAALILAMSVIPLAVLVGAIVVYGILSLSLILSGIIDLIDRARVGRQASDVS